MYWERHCSAGLVDQRIEWENPGISVLGRKIILTSHLVGTWLVEPLPSRQVLFDEKYSLKLCFFERNFGVSILFLPTGFSQHHWGPNNLIQWHETYLHLVSDQTCSIERDVEVNALPWNPLLLYKPYHSETDGLMERWDDSLKAKMR